MLSSNSAAALTRGIEWAIGGFMERHPLLTALLEDDRIYDIPKTLLGSDFILALSDALIRVGDTAWHGRNPSRESPTSTYHPTVKVGIYFETVKKETGCLRVIPGTTIASPSTSDHCGDRTTIQLI